MERWQQIESLFQEALQRPVGERDAWLREACGTDAELHREVASLLANHHESASATPWAAAAVSAIVTTVMTMIATTIATSHRLFTIAARRAAVIACAWPLPHGSSFPCPPGRRTPSG